VRVRILAKWIFTDAPFRKIIKWLFRKWHIRTVPGNMNVRFKSVALTVLELLAFNVQKFRGHVILARPLFEKFLRVMSGLSLETCTSNLIVLNWSGWPVRCAQTNTHTHTHTHTQTHIERKQYLRHSLRSLGRDNKLTCLRYIDVTLMQPLQMQSCSSAYTVAQSLTMVMMLVIARRLRKS